MSIKNYVSASLVYANASTILNIIQSMVQYSNFLYFIITLTPSLLWLTMQFETNFIAALDYESVTKKLSSIISLCLQENLNTIIQRLEERIT